MSNKSSNKAKLKRLAHIASLLRDRSLLEKIGEAYETFVKRRTRSGKDVNERPFTPYSRQYAKKRKRLGLQTHIVTLEAKEIGGMLQSVDHVVFNDLDGVKAYIDGQRQAQIGYYHAVSGAGKSHVIREWWGLSKKGKEKIQGIIQTKLDEIFKTKL
jgi:hypothetical protein